MEKSFLLYSSCIPVKGYSRSIICDLQYNKYSLIPNSLFEILQKFNGKTLPDVLSVFKNEGEKEVIREYFDFLHEGNFIFFTNHTESFPKMSLDWKEPLPINNAIIDFSSENKNEVINYLDKIDKLGVKFLQLRYFDTEVEINELLALNEFLENIESSIISISYVLKYNSQFNENSINDLLMKFPRITSMLFYEAPKDFDYFLIKENTVFFFENKILSEISCGLINEGNFAINIKSFTESLNHNSCLNRKISIDKDGNIKNCPSMTQSFGNIKDTTLEEALSHPDFKKYWNVTKDQIAVCKDCEFRHICTDCRAYTERTHFEGDIDLSKPVKCGYNPYTNEWAEWSINPLKQKAIEYYGMQELVKNG
jgi:SPASM domain peptide maturase of grasp-with-spasm system